MDISNLRTFRAVAEVRHFAKAADLCNLSQPAVSHQISRLEEEVGARLFNRTGRSVSLTVVGEVLLEEARRVLATIDRAEERVREAALGAIGRIRFGASPTAGLYLLGGLLVEYRQRHPAYDMHVEIGLESELLDRVARNELDMAVVAGELPTGELRARPIAEDHLVAMASPAVASGLARRGDIARLAREVTWLLREPGSDTRRQLDRWFEQHRVGPARALTLVGPDAVMRAAENGLGLAIASSRCAAVAVVGRRLAVVDVRPRLPVRRYSVVDHPHKHHGAACQAMLAHLNRLFRPAEPLAPGGAPAIGAARRTPAGGRPQRR